MFAAGNNNKLLEHARVSCVFSNVSSSTHAKDDCVSCIGCEFRLLSRSSKKHSTKTKIVLQRPRQKLILVRKHKVYTFFKSSSDGFYACRPCDCSR